MKIYVKKIKCQKLIRNNSKHDLNVKAMYNVQSNICAVAQVANHLSLSELILGIYLEQTDN